MVGTVAEWSERCGISRQMGYKRLERAGVPVTRGRVDFGAADRAWDRIMDPSQQQRSLQQRTAQERRGASPAAEPSPIHAARSVSNIGTGPIGTKALAQLKREMVKLEKETIELAVMKGRLIQADQVRAAETERATAEREALLNWPARIAPDLAARFGVTERDMFVALDAAVREYLTERSQQPLAA